MVSTPVAGATIPGLIGGGKGQQNGKGQPTGKGQQGGKNGGGKNQSGKGKPAPGSLGPCNEWARSGTCHRGDACWYRHV